jgi:hypothetical protein
MSTTTQQPAESTTPAPPDSTIFTMRLELPMTDHRSGLNRMIHACADIITHLGDTGIGTERKHYITDPWDGRIVTGEWSLAPDPDPTGTATYAFNQHEIATMRTALRFLAKSRVDVAELTSEEMFNLCERLNPLDAVTR